MQTPLSFPSVTEVQKDRLQIDPAPRANVTDVTEKTDLFEDSEKSVTEQVTTAPIDRNLENKTDLSTENIGSDGSDGYSGSRSGFDCNRSQEKIGYSDEKIGYEAKRSVTGVDWR